ncbi:TetR/AcrR family transcriptional regulator [Aquabacter spiritensis]|uniref:TetR family transcriptional regulator n=1 Tax=Aquabacter spiritensis TaxID=933073 RepID=A0A4R3M8K1_9HYPH|nr:TetR/AcrR family transcriptional regulator [Aquabacter spiritensis]TCT07675.1 TetR family transcriptional regulator [Aquabacter spiritensis]
MGRRREFDEEEALDAAIACFWQSGYGATSVRDLAHRMEIGGASLYHAFGDKRGLYSSALQRYLDLSSRRRVASLDAAAEPLAALHAFFGDLVAASVADPRGCLLINSAIEVAPLDAALGADIRAALDEVEGGLRRTLERAQRDGSLDPGANCQDLSRRLLSAIVSIRVLSRVPVDRATLESIARSALPPVAR